MLPAIDAPTRTSIAQGEHTVDHVVDVDTPDEWEFAAARPRRALRAPDVTRVLPAPASNRWTVAVDAPARTGRLMVVIDGSGPLSHTKSNQRSWTALLGSCDQLYGGRHDALIVDAAMSNRLSDAEREMYEEAILRQEVVAVPAGCRGGTRKFLEKLGQVEGVVVIQAPDARQGRFKSVRAQGRPGSWHRVPRLDHLVPSDGAPAAPASVEVSVEPGDFLGRSGGTLVREARRKAGMSRARLARFAGVDTRLVELVETRAIDLRVSELRRLLDAAGYTLTFQAVAGSDQPQGAPALSSPTSDQQRSPTAKKRTGKSSTSRRPASAGAATGPIDHGPEVHPPADQKTDPRPRSDKTTDASQDATILPTTEAMVLGEQDTIAPTAHGAIDDHRDLIEPRTDRTSPVLA